MVIFSSQCFCKFDWLPFFEKVLVEKNWEKGSLRKRKRKRWLPVNLTHRYFFVFDNIFKIWFFDYFWLRIGAVWNSKIWRSKIMLKIDFNACLWCNFFQFLASLYGTLVFMKTKISDNHLCSRVYQTHPIMIAQDAKLP